MMSSHYHFAIFLAIIVATATAAADNGCEQTTVPVISVTYELNVDELDKPKYIKFLEDVRKLLANRYIEGVPLLPPQTLPGPPPQWLDLKLKAQGKETTVKIRGDNLYVVGYQTQETPKWYEVKNRDNKHTIDGSQFLTFRGDYPDLLRAAGLSSITEVPLSKSAFIEAVEALAGPKPSDEANIAKAVIVVAQMVSEACRFDRIAQYFGTNLGKPDTKLEEWMLPCLERKWGFFSSVVLCDHKYHKEDFVAQTTVTDLLSRLGIILDTKISEFDEDYDDELPNVIDLRAHLHDVVKSATNDPLLAPPRPGDADDRAVV